MDLRGWRRRAGSRLIMPLLLCCALLFSISAPFSVAASDVGSLSSSFQSQAAGRRWVLSGGPGSYPPLCAAKCGDCTPCTPVHVTVPPGRPVIDEYYPEAWRCKCGNKLYMP